MSNVFRSLLALVLLLAGLPVAAMPVPSGPILDFTPTIDTGNFTAPYSPVLAQRDFGGETYFLAGWNLQQTQRTVFLRHIRLNRAKHASIEAVGEAVDIFDADSNWSYAYVTGAAYNRTRDEYLVTWTGTRKSGGTSESGLFYRRIIASTLEPIGEARRLTASGANAVDVVWNSVSDHYVVAWPRYDFGRYRIETRAIAGDGTPLTTVTQIDRTDGKLSNEECEHPLSFVPDGKGGLLLAFANSNGGDGDGAFNIVVRHLDALGQPVSGRVLVNRESGDNSQFMCNPALAPNPAGDEVLLHWRAATWNGPAEGWPIRALIFSGAPEDGESTRWYLPVPNFPSEHKSLPFGVKARWLTGDNIEFLWMRDITTEVPEEPTGVSWYAVESRRISDDGAVSTPGPEDIAWFHTESDAYLLGDQLRPFLFDESGSYAMLSWFEYKKSWIEDSRSALRAMLLAYDTAPGTPEQDPETCGVPLVSVPNGEHGLRIVATRNCGARTIEVTVENNKDTPLAHAVLFIDYPVTTEPANFAMTTGDCDWQDHLCAISDMAPAEQRTFVFVPVTAPAIGTAVRFGVEFTAIDGQRELIETLIAYGEDIDDQGSPPGDEVGEAPATPLPAEPVSPLDRESATDPDSSVDGGPTGDSSAQATGTGDGVTDDRLGVAEVAEPPDEAGGGAQLWLLLLLAVACRRISARRP